MSAAPVPVYFETSWSILSSIGLVNVLIGFLVIGITNLSPLTLVPILVSAAGAISDGLCYYAFYEPEPKIPTAVAAVFADLFWGIQEAGLSLYSYMILIRILRGRDRKLFMIMYWTGIGVVFAFKITITIFRIEDILQGTLNRVLLIDRMHIGYFVGIALIEVLSSYFLLRKFFTAQKTSSQLNSRVGLFSYLMRSTEIRLLSLTIIGITRSITYSFQTSAQSATNVAGQVDRFVVVLECMFPIIMYIDILSAKTFSASGSDHISPHYNSSKVRSNAAHIGQRSGTQGVYSMTNMETRVDAPHARTSSQEHIVNRAPSARSTDGDFESDGKGGINKTVEFVFSESGRGELEHV